MGDLTGKDTLERPLDKVGTDTPLLNGRAASKIGNDTLEISHLRRPLIHVIYV